MKLSRPAWNGNLLRSVLRVVFVAGAFLVALLHIMLALGTLVAKPFLSAYSYILLVCAGLLIAAGILALLRKPLPVLVLTLFAVVGILAVGFVLRSPPLDEDMMTFTQLSQSSFLRFHVLPLLLLVPAVWEFVLWLRARLAREKAQDAQYAPVYRREGK